MKKLAIFLIALAFVSSLAAWRNHQQTLEVFYPIGKDIPITVCGSFPFPDSILGPARIFSDLGNHHYPVTTTSPKAQEFFDQGLRLWYGYNHWEALRSFREAARFDPSCGMAYWGIALSLGPYINDPNPKDREKMAFDAIQKAKARTAALNPIEVGFINALAARFNGKSYDDRDSLNQAYYHAMASLAKKFPADLEAQTFFADAIMSTVPWKWWELNGKPVPQTLEARPILESVLKVNPKHPGANHLYIHLMEESPTPELANASAEFLETALPAAGHLVHMPGHIYQRTGQYQKSIETNLRAVAADEKYLAESLSEDYGFYRAGYHPHNIDFIGYSAFMTGQRTLANRTETQLVYRSKSLAVFFPALYSYILTLPMMSYVRFGEWDKVLTESLPDRKDIIATIFWRYARGMAYLRKDFVEDARREFHQLDSINRLDTLKSISTGYNPMAPIANIATRSLSGEILIHEKKFDAGIKELTLGAAAEDSLAYNEPPDWRIPVRHYLGAELLKAGKFKEAEQVYLTDLKMNRNNGWALQGLMQCQIKLGKQKEAAATKAKFEAAWKNADVRITSSVF